MSNPSFDGPDASPANKPAGGPRPKTEGEVRGVRDTGDPPAAAVQPSNQPAQVDPREAKLSREDIAKKIPPPGLMGDAAGPSA